MKMLGLNPLEQEIIDLSNNIVKSGLIYFPEFCKIIQDKFRQDDEELFRQTLFKVISATNIFQTKILCNIRLFVARSHSLTNSKLRNTNLTIIS